MDIENMSTEKAIERCKQLIKPEHANWIGISNQVAIIRVLNELEKKDKYIKMLTDEREHIKNNLKVDLNKKGVFSQAKGQIAQILEYYQNNEEYFKKVKKEGK